DQTTISGAMAFRINNGTDNYIRYCSSPASIRTWLGAAAIGGDASYVKKAGDTMTGNLLFSNSGTAWRGIQGQIADNDYWRIGGAGTATNAGYMEIATADDSNEPIYVRQYTGTFTSLTRTATLLDASGNTSFPNTVTAQILSSTRSGKTSTISSENTSHTHYRTTADSGHWFDKDIRVQGNIYCGPSYNQLVWSTANLAFGTGATNMATGNHTHTPAQVGLGNVANFGYSNAIGDNSTARYATTNMVAQVRAEKVNKAGDTMTGEIYNSLGSSWITGRDRAVINVGCGDASYASAIRSRGTNHTFALGVLGNSQFGFYRYNNTETGNTTNSSFYMDNTGAMRATGTITSPTFIGALQGNANTATQLATTRSINGTNFNGTGNITTANWGTARTLTVGSTGKSVSGSGNVAWSLAEIGAAATSHTHSYAPTSHTHPYMADGGSYGTIYLNNWIRTSGSTGWYSQTYGGGWYMVDTTWIRTYGSKPIHVAGADITCTNNIIAYYSDIRLKKNFNKVDGALDKVMKVNPYYYEQNDFAKELGYNEEGKIQIGFKAQEMKTILPQVILTAPVNHIHDMTKSTREKIGDDPILTIDYGKITPLLWGAIQELKREIDELKSQLSK
ncbi:MAG: tail fiber domain-containing protein, partial [Fusobacteriaceae bacterium]